MNEPINLSVKKRPVAVVSPSTNLNSINKIISYKPANSSTEIRNYSTELIKNTNGNELKSIKMVEPETFLPKISTEPNELRGLSSIFNNYWNNNTSRMPHAMNTLTTITSPSMVSPILNFFENKQTLEAAHSHLDRYLKLTNQYLRTNQLISSVSKNIESSTNLFKNSCNFESTNKLVNTDINNFCNNIISNIFHRVSLTVDNDKGFPYEKEQTICSIILPKDDLKIIVEKKPHIKKPLNAFMLYMKEMRAKVVAECTLKESAAINQILGRRVSN